MLINRGGAVIVLELELVPEQEIHIQRKDPAEVHRQSPVRIVRADRPRARRLSVRNRNSAWERTLGDQFPERPSSLTRWQNASGRQLLQRPPKVVHLNELELRVFEINPRGIARHCKTCRVPSICNGKLRRGRTEGPIERTRGRRAKEVPGSASRRGEQREERSHPTAHKADRVHSQAGHGRRTRGLRRYFSDWHVLSKQATILRRFRRRSAVPYSPKRRSIFSSRTYRLFRRNSEGRTFPAWH